MFSNDVKPKYRFTTIFPLIVTLKCEIKSCLDWLVNSKRLKTQTNELEHERIEAMRKCRTGEDDNHLLLICLDYNYVLFYLM